MFRVTDKRVKGGWDIEGGLPPVVCLALCLAVMLAAGCALAPSIIPRGDGKSPVVKETLFMSTQELKGYPEGVKPVDASAEGSEMAETLSKEAGPVSPGDIPATWSDVDSADYTIGAGDMLEFRSYDDDTLTRQAVVRYDGCISLPLIPDINVQSKTRQEASDLLREAFSAVFREPQITLTIVQSASKSFYVMGEVQGPREYPYMRRITLLDAINTAGGPRINQRSGDSFMGSQGQLAKAFIIRHENEGRKVYGFDLKNLSTPGAHASDTPVLPGDIVYVPEGLNLVYVIGEIRRPGVLQLREGMTLMQLLSQVGGFSESTARMRRLVLMREVDEKTTKVMLIDTRMMIKTGQDMLIEPGDIVYIPRKPLVNAREFVGRVTGTISPVLSLYTQVLDAYYAQDRWDRILNDSNSSTSEVLAVLQGLNNVASSLPPLVTPVVP